MRDVRSLCRVFQLYRASVLFETIRHETQHSTDYKLSLFDLQTGSYQALQRVLVSLGESAGLSLVLLLLLLLLMLWDAPGFARGDDAIDDCR